jgi:arabinogalactan endo-1,4-beta-galactosidase
MKNSWLHNIFIAMSLSTLAFASLAAESPTPISPFYLGADLSYVNEMEDCGATFYEHKKQIDPFELFAKKGANIVRVRLWHNPQWTKYSNFEDVVKTLTRAKKHNLPVMLDIHYSDDWADPERQEIPKAWEALAPKALEAVVFQYTYKVLSDLKSLDLLPTMVQVGNETNTEIMQPIGKTDKNKVINWQRNAALLNQGIRAVREFSAQYKHPINIILHIAQPENALAWFPQATQAGITDYDTIGLSYYPKWSTQTLTELSASIKTLRSTYHKDVLIVETAYPWTLKNNDAANNLYDKNGLHKGFPATKKGQLHYLENLKKAVKDAGGNGVVYWEPAWVSSECGTRWGNGSHWDNATFFDHNNNALPSFEFFKPI